MAHGVITKVSIETLFFSFFFSFLNFEFYSLSLVDIYQFDGYGVHHLLGYSGLFYNDRTLMILYIL